MLLPFIVQQLNKLLDPELSPHVLSYQFHLLAEQCLEQNIVIDLKDVYPYYADPELELVRKAMTDAAEDFDYQQSFEYGNELYQLRREKPNCPLLYREAVRFEIQNSKCIYAYLPEASKHALFRKLIASYFHNNLYETKKAIREMAIELRKTKEAEALLALELEAKNTVLWFMIERGFDFPDYDLEAIYHMQKNADREKLISELLFRLQTHYTVPNPIKAHPDVVEIVNYYHKAFWKIQEVM